MYMCDIPGQRAGPNWPNFFFQGTQWGNISNFCWLENFEIPRAKLGTAKIMI